VLRATPAQTAVTLAFISAIFDDQEQSVLTAVQLLWVNLIMDTMAALALATEPPSDEVLNRPPHGKKTPLISFHMWRMIIGQSVFQVRPPCNRPRAKRGALSAEANERD